MSEKSGRRLFFAVAVVIALSALPLSSILGSRGNLALCGDMFIAAIFALSYNVLLGQTGLLSFGHAIYFGSGAFAAIYAMRWGEIPLPLIPLVGASCALLVGFVLGGLSARRAGAAFAMITLGFGELTNSLAGMLGTVFGGEQGVIADRRAVASFFGIDFGKSVAVYYLVLAWFLFSAALLYFATRTPLGRMFNALRDNKERVAFFGYKQHILRLAAVLIAAAFAGVAGALFAISYETVSADTFSLFRSGMVVIMVCLGGGAIWGPAVGAFIVTWLQFSLSAFTTAWPFYLGSIFVGTVLFMPDGLAGLAERLLRLAREIGAARFVLMALLLSLSALPAALGGVGLIEMWSRLHDVDSMGTTMTLRGFPPIDVTNAANWAIAAGAAVAGILLCRATWRRTFAEGNRIAAPGNPP